MVSRSSSTASAVNFPEKIETALRALEDCRMCPRDCGVNRLENRWAACKTGRYAIVDCITAGLARSPSVLDRKSTRLNSSHITISYAVFCLKKKKQKLY